jgi:hypothetical protein
MRLVKWMSVAGVVLVLFSVSCSNAPTTAPSPTPVPLIGREKAIAIAATQVPLKLVQRGAVYTKGNSTKVVFERIGATREELGWSEDVKTVFQPDYANSGPPGTYATLMVTVNPSTGEIDKRSALKLPNGGYISVSGPPPSRFGCTRPTPSPTPAPAISKEKAIAIAATQVPLALAQRCVLRADIIGGSPWRIIFDRVNTTRDELNWTDDGHTRFDPGGGQTAPPGQFIAVMVAVNSSNGMIEQRLATNGVFLGVPPP